MENEDQYCHHTLKLDPWAASSLLQKAIRRGDAELAKHAARVFYHQRGNAIWRRLIHIAFEDVGIGDPQLISDLTFLATEKKLRAMMGEDSELVLGLCDRLALAPKDRSSDYLYCAAAKLPGPRQEQALLSTMDIAEQIAIAADPVQPLIRRAAATLSSCSVTGETAQLAANGALPLLIASLSKHCTPPLLEAVAAAARASCHPFILMLPLLQSALAAEKATPTILHDLVPQPAILNGIPLYTFDKHTRAGKQAITIFARQCCEVRGALAEHVPDFMARDVALIAAFYADAMPIARRFEWEQSRSLEALGLQADMIGAGCPNAGIMPVLASVRNNLDELNDLRRHAVLGRAGA